MLTIQDLRKTYITTGKNIVLTLWTFVSQVMSLLFNALSRFVITFLPRNKRLISWPQSLSSVILKHKKIKSVTASTLFPFYFHEHGTSTRCHYLIFFNVEFQVNFFTFPFHPHQEALSSSSLSPIRVLLSAYLRLFGISPSNLYSSL